MLACIRNIVLSRLRELGLRTLRLPIGATEKDNHVPILVSPDLAQKKHIIVLFSEVSQDLGIFSYRTCGNEGINEGSAVNFVSAILNGVASVPGQDVPGIILANPGQLLWHRGGGQAVTRSHWANLPRETAVDGPFRIDELKNKIPGNEDFDAHVNYIFHNVIHGMVAKDARIDVVGLEWAGRACIRHLSANWEKYAPRVGGVCLASPQHDLSDLENADFVDFMRRNARAYFVSSSPVGTAISDDADFGCECYASGEELYPENIITKAAVNMLAWLSQLEH